MFATNYTGGQLVYPLLYDYPENEFRLLEIESVGRRFHIALKILDGLGHCHSTHEWGFWYHCARFR